MTMQSLNRQARRRSQKTRQPAPVSLVPAANTDTLAAAFQRHQQGNLAEAEQGYREILAAMPDHADALHLLGVVHLQRDQAEAAVDLIRRAIDKKPDVADYFANLGAALQKLDRFDEAERAYDRTLVLNPRQTETLTNLALIHEKGGRVAEAIACCRRAADINPDLLKAYRKAIELLLADRRYAEATEWLERMVARWPEDADALSNLGFCCDHLGADGKAEELFRRALALKPSSREILNNLAVLLRRRGRMKEAEEFFGKAMGAGAEEWESEVHHAGWLANVGDLNSAAKILLPYVEKNGEDVTAIAYLGSILCRLGRFSEAHPWIVKALEFNAEDAELWCLLGSIFAGMKDQFQAEAALRKAIELNPTFLNAHLNLCEIFDVQNRRDEATLRSRAVLYLPGFGPEVMVYPYKAFRGSCDFESIDAMGNIWESASAAMSRGYLPIIFLHLLVESDTIENARELARLHRAWAERGELLARTEEMPPLRPVRGREKLRVALLSSDLRGHSVANFVRPLLRNYDRNRLEIIAYSTQRVANDVVQAEIRRLVDRFVDVEVETNRGLAEMARGDQIDVLIELNGFTAGSRIGALPLRLAPIQIAWLGYPFTTGYRDADYLIVDPYVKPTVPDLLVEKPLELPHSWLCVEGYPEDEVVDPVPPCERNGFVTFGTLNNPYKFNRACFAAWAKVMHAVPDSRFLVVRPQGQSRILAENLIKAFGANGIGPERIFILSNKPREHLACYNSIDVALDTFPVTGGTTTCDALWMGVPTVTLRGAGMHQRVSHSALMQANLGELSTDNVGDYVKIAVALANDRDALRLLRSTLRDVVKASPLFDGKLFAAGFQDALETAAREKGLR